MTRPTSVSAPRRAAFEVLRRVFEHDAWADRALPAALGRNAVAPEERGIAQRLAYGAVQRRGTSDALIAEFSGRPVGAIDPPLLAAMRLGIFELLFSHSTPNYAAVDQAVELAKGSARSARAAGLVNAVLRRAVGEAQPFLDALPPGTQASVAILHSHPQWLAEKWWRELGEARATSLMAADNEPLETGLRANSLRSDRDSLFTALRDAGVDARPARGPAPLDVPEMLTVDGPVAGASALIEGGELVPQSRASGAVVGLLDPRPGERVLDMCAAPGIKSTQIAARMQGMGQIVAVERDPGRASSLRELAARLGAGIVEVIEADAGRDDLGGGYDRVLVDPPCSDLGTLASRPDARWRKSPELIDRLVEEQRAILHRAAAATKQGGTLVYSICSISAPEGEQQIDGLLRSTGGALQADDLGSSFPELASPADSRFLQTLPDRDRTDGFFIARLRRGSS